MSWRAVAQITSNISIFNQHPHLPQAKMVCSKCQKKLKSTELATPGVKRKNEMYYGSPSSTLGGGDKGKATLGATGIGKV